jgi:hypothetical protein
MVGRRGWFQVIRGPEAPRDQAALSEFGPAEFGNQEWTQKKRIDA